MVQGMIVKAICSPGANTTAIRSMKRHEEHISKVAASQISLLCILWYLSCYVWNMHKNMNTFSLLSNSLFATLLI